MGQAALAPRGTSPSGSAGSGNAGLPRRGEAVHPQIFDWALFNKLFAVADGLLLARALLTWQFPTAEGCVSCGRRVGGAGWTTAVSAACWGRWAAGTAALIPLLYAVVWFAWAAGIPLGISTGFPHEMQDTGLGAVAAVGDRARRRDPAYHLRRRGACRRCGRDG